MKLRRNFCLGSLLTICLSAAPFGAQAGNIWDGGGGTDTNIDTPANWDADTAPVLTDGSETLTFASDGSAAAINTNVSVAGILFNRDANFAITNGAGSLTIGTGGIGVTLPTTTARTHTISESNILLGGSQTWSVTNNTGAARLDVSSVIDDGSSTFTLTKAGSGTLVLSGANTFGGNVNFLDNSSGVIIARNSAAFGTGPKTVAATVGNGARVELDGTSGALSFANNVNFNVSGSALRNTAGNNTINGILGAANGAGTGVVEVLGGSLTLSGTVRAVNTGGRTITFQGSSTSSSNRIQGQVIDGSSAFTLAKDGTGTWTITRSDNTYTGASNINRGTLNIAAIANYDVSSSLGRPASGDIRLGNAGNTGTLRYTGSGHSSNRTFQIGNNSGTPLSTDIGGGTITNDGAGALTFTAATFNTAQTGVIASTARVLTLSGSNTGANEISGVIQDNTAGVSGTSSVAVTKDGAGSWTLSNPANTYTGATNVNRGTLSIATIADYGLSCSLGASSAGDIRLGHAGNSGTLRYTGAAASCNRTVQIGNNSATPAVGDVGGAGISNDGTGPLTFTAATFNTAQSGVIASSARVLTLGGSNADENTISGVIQDNVVGVSGDGTVSLAKTGSGAWHLAGDNTYSGDTIVNDGSLTLTPTGQLKFFPKTNGVSNKVSGPPAGTAAFNANGMMLIDLSAADTIVGNSWVLVDVANLNESYAETFTVESSLGAFSETSPGVWELVNAERKWTFTESTGVLAVANTLVDDYADWAGSSGFNLSGGATGDDDGDGLSNFLEYAFGLNPTSAASSNPISQPLDRVTGTFKYTRRATPATSGVVYSYESSTSLGGAWTEFPADSETSNSASPVEEVTVDLPDALLAEPRLFIRVKAVKP